MSNKFFCKIAFVGLLVTFAPVTFGKICWDSPWYNSSSPADHSGSDNESQPIDVLNTICPDGSMVINARCRDEKGEPFSDYKKDTSNKYIANCTVATGLLCHPYEDGTCADFAIQYGCACPTTLPSQTTPPGGSGIRGPSSNTIVNGGVGSTSGPGGSSSGPSGIGSSPSGIRSSLSGIGSSPRSIGSSPSGIGSSPSGIGSNPSGVTSGSVGSGPSGSSTGNTNGQGSTGSGSSGQSVGIGSSGSSGGRNSSENGSNGSSAFGSYCPCRNGSHKIDGTFYAVLLSVSLMLRLF